MRQQFFTAVFTAILILGTSVAGLAQSRDEELIASEAPSWALRNAAMGVWNELVDLSGLNFTDDEDDELAEDFAFVRRGTVTGEPLTESAIFRGQISPPVVSPTSSYGQPTYSGNTNTSGYNSGSNYSYSGSNPTNTYSYDQAQSSVVNPPATADDPTTIKRIFKYQQDASADVLYIPRANGGLGVTELTGGLFFAFPCETLQGAKVNQGAFRLTPRFTYTAIDKPKEGYKGPNLPKNLFDAGLQTSFSVQTGDFQGNVEIQVGVASEFKKIKKDTFYIRGRAEGALPIDDARRTHILGGVSYYNRLKYKLLPVAGLIWKPNNENEFRLVFPDPMWGHFLGKANETDWWFFVHGDVGGGKWLLTDFEHKLNGKESYVFDYDDYRLSAGLRFDCPKGMVGSFEFGGSFGREIRTKEGVVYKPKNSVLLKAGVFF